MANRNPANLSSSRSENAPPRSGGRREAPIGYDAGIRSRARGASRIAEITKPNMDLMPLIVV
jgi:hypothetical protein